MITGIRLIIYDLDGVLVDTSDAICISFNAALEDAGEAPRSDEEIRGMIGVPLDEMYRRVLPRERWGLVEGCFERYREVPKPPSKHTDASICFNMPQHAPI